ncbi:MAG: hypothetical protein Tsb0010_15660 [Parvularculaceae bacterium]
MKQNIVLGLIAGAMAASVQGARAQLTALAGQNAEIAAAFDLVFQAEAGSWAGECRVRNPENETEWRAIPAEFVITHSANAPHAFAGRYGDEELAGEEIIDRGRRIGVMRSAAGETALNDRIISVRYESPTSYSYTEETTESGARPIRSTVTRMGDLQINYQSAPATGVGARRPVQFCQYRKTG